MADVGSALIRVQLAQDYLNKQVAGIQADLAKIKDVRVTATDGGSFARLVAGVNEFQNSVAQASQYVQGLSATASQLGQIADALTGATKAAVSATIGLDSAQTKVSTLTGETVELTAAARQLADDLENQAATADILEGSYDVLSSGFTEVSSVIDVMRASTYAAVGGFTDVSTASDALTSVMNAYGQSTYEASRVADILIATQDAGKITVAQYGALIGKVASTAAQAGVSLEELSGFVANATVKGVKAGASIDGLRQAMANVLKPTKMAAEEAARLGIEFNESALKTKGLKGILADIAATGDTSNGTLIKLFGTVEAVAALTPSAGANLGSLEAQIAKITDSAGKAEAGFNKVSGSLEGQLTSASNQGREALTSLGQGAVAVLLPLAGAALQLISAFNGLPEPVKASAGAILTVTAGAVAAGAAVTGLLAIVPVITAGWSAMGVAFGTTTAAQVASTTATTAQAAAQAVVTATTPALTANLAQAATAATGLAAAETAATVSTTGLAAAIDGASDPVGEVVDSLTEAGSSIDDATDAMADGTVKASAGANGLAASSTTASAATTGLRASLAGLAGQVAAMLGPLALAAAAAIALKGGWDAVAASTGNGEVASSVSEAVDEINKLKPAADKATASTGPLAEKFGVLGQAFENFTASAKENGGVFGAISAQLDSLADKLNLPFDVYTAKQVDAQLATIAFEEVVTAVGDRLDTGRSLLEKYGQASGEAGKRTKLSSDQVAEFSTKAKEQVDAIQATLDALKKVKPADDAHQASLDANIALLTQQKKVLEERTQALGVDTTKLEENGAATQFLTDKIAGLADAYKAAADASDLATAESQADILDQAVDAGQSAGDVQQAITEAERSGLENRIKIASEKGNELRKLLEEASGDPAKTKEVQAEIAKIEGDLFRDRQALANSVLQERQQNEDKAKQAAEEAARDSERASEEAARAAEKSAQEQEQAAQEVAKAQKEAADAAKEALEQQVTTADNALSLQEARLKNSLQAQLVAIKEQQVAGQLSKEQADQAKLEATEASLKRELEEVAKAEKVAQDLRAKGAISEEELQQRLVELQANSNQVRGELADQALEAQESKAKASAQAQEGAAKEGAKGEIQTAEDRLEADKKLREEQVRAAEDAYSQAVKAAQVGAAEELAAVKQAQAAGDLDPETAAAQEAAIRDRANQAELAQINKQIAEVNKLKRQGALSADEAEAKLLDLRASRAQTETAIAEAQIQATEKANQDSIKAKEEAEQAKAKAAEEAAKKEQEAQVKAEESKRQQLEATQQTRELALSKAKTQEAEQVALAYETSRARGESREQLDARLARIEMESLARAKSMAQDELGTLDDLVNQGVLTDAEANKKKEELRQQLAQLRIQQTQAEEKADEAAHQAELARIDQRIKAVQQEGQQAIQTRQLAADQLGLEQSNLGSLVSLTKARNDLEAQRLANNLKDADTDQEKLAAQQAINSQKVSALMQEQQFAREQLDLEIQQRDIELEQKAIAAQSALIESQLALEKAKASGASQTELDLLGRQVALREQGLAQVAKSVAFNGQVLETRQREELALRQQKDLESTVRQAAEAVQPLLGQPNLEAGQLTNQQVYGNSGPVMPAPATNPLANPNLNLGMPNQALQSIGNSTDNLSQAVNQLSQALKKQGCNPNSLTVVTSDPASDLTEILRQLAK